MSAALQVIKNGPTDQMAGMLHVKFILKNTCDVTYLLMIKSTFAGRRQCRSRNPVSIAMLKPYCMDQSELRCVNKC